MKKRPLGATGLQVSEVGFGAWAIGGNDHGNSYGPTEDSESLKALNRAYDLGCTLFDSADVYGHGHSEVLLGKAMKGWKREEVVIATKGGGDFYSSPPRLNFSAKHLTFAVEQSLNRLQTDHIDLYQLHNPSMALIQNGQVFEVLKTLQQQGKIRFYGLSIFDPQEGIQAIEHGQVQSIQGVYNLLDRRPEKGLLEVCTEEQVGFIAREPLANGFLTGKFQPFIAALPDLAKPLFSPGDIRSNWPPALIAARAQAAEQFRQCLPPTLRDEAGALAQLALRFVLAQKAISSVIVGCKTVAQVEENFTVAQHSALDPETLRLLQDSDRVFA